MKLLFLIMICFTSAISRGDEISPIPLITPVSYDRPSSRLQSISSELQIFAGDLAGIKIDEAIKKEVAPFSKDLSKYFPKPNELNNLLSAISTNINATIIKGKMTDDKVIAVYEYLGDHLIGRIADRILDTEGVKDEKRRQLWVNKILAPFKSCIDDANNARYDASHCMKALSAGLVANIGSGLVYELSRSNLSASLPASEQLTFNQDQTKFYQTCLNKFLPKPSSKNVNDCSLSAMKNGVEKITDGKLNTTLDKSASGPEVGQKIKKYVWPSFDGCVQAVGTDKSITTTLSQQFSSCIDGLIQTTGMQIVSDKILNNPSLVLTFNQSEIKKLSADKMAQFKKCSQDLISKNIRKKGIIDTDICENAITNDLFYQAVLKKFHKSAEEQVKGTNIDPNNLDQEGKKILDRCWKQTQNADQREDCLRITVIEYSKLIAEKRLEVAIPADIASRKKIKSDSLLAFKACLEKKVPTKISTEDHLSEKMEPCTSGLLHSATGSVVEESVDKAITENLKDQKDMNLSDQRVSVRAQILGAFNKCLASKSDTSDCTDQVKKDATLSIALAAGRASLSQQLPESKTPSKEYLEIENSLKSCTDSKLQNEALAKHLDGCKKKFVIELARNIGTEKFNNTLKSLLGKKKFEESKIHTAIVLSNFNACLDNLYKEYREVTFCTDQLTRDGELVFKENVNQWMSSDEKDAATIAIKAQFVDFLPCLGGLLPTSGSTPATQVEKDVAPFMEILAKALAQYIEYSPENAKQSLDQIIKQLSKDLHDTADTAVARKNLIDLLYKNGAFDQFLKSYVRKLVSDSFANIPDGLLSKDLKNALTSKENFDAIFAGPEGKNIKDTVLNKLINPIIIDGKSGSTPEMALNISVISDQVTRLLINSPQFGEKIIGNQIQGSLDNIGTIKGFFVKVFYGGSSALDWQKVRLTDEGQAAENYIKENIMTPKFKNISISESEVKKRNEEAERMVTEAVKKYKKH